ncbi:MAG TPA: hypothetical protein VFY60_01090 [Pyrinomonadaceae bacterium]|nr:hypothetical protein [Pyrinomonadaceae bacterium]
MLIPRDVLNAVMDDPLMRDKEASFILSVIVGSAVYHSKRLAGVRFELQKVSPLSRKQEDITFPTSRRVKIFIRMLQEGREVEMEAGFPRSITRIESLVLMAIATSHNAVAKRIGTKIELDLFESFLDGMDGLIIDTSLVWMAEEELGIAEKETELIGKVRRFMESLMTTSYERRVSEIAVSVQRAKGKRGAVPTDIEALLTSKKTRALFAGHRHLLMCNLQGEAYGYRSLPPYPDIELMPKNSALYPAPYEYQPILKFSHKHKALVFVLTRRREIMVVLGASIVLIRDDKGWRILALERFIGILSDQLWKNSKKRLSKTEANTLATYISMLCLSLRQHGKGGLLVISRAGTQLRAAGRAESSAETVLSKHFSKPIGL